jgi:hypothetical protein
LKDFGWNAFRGDFRGSYTRADGKKEGGLLPLPKASPALQPGVAPPSHCCGFKTKHCISTRKAGRRYIRAGTTSRQKMGHVEVRQQEWEKQEQGTEADPEREERQI